MKGWLVAVFFMHFTFILVGSQPATRDVGVQYDDDIGLQSCMSVISDEQAIFMREVFFEEFRKIYEQGGHTIESQLLYCINRFRDLDIKGFPKVRAGLRDNQKVQEKRLADAFGMICEEISRKKLSERQG